MKKEILSVLLCAGISVAPACADDTYIAPVDEAWRTAQAQYADGRFADAFGNFYWAAIRDHAQAQEIVGMMYLLGPETYGPAVRHDFAEAEFWLAEAARRGREVARHVLCMAPRGNRQDGARVNAAATRLRGCAPGDGG